jgi:hypothetical protein
MLVTDINDNFEMAIPEGDYDTIAGFIFNCLGRLAEINDKVTLNKHGEASVNGGEFEIPRGSHPSSDRTRSTQLIEAEEDETITYFEFIVEIITGNRIETVRLHKITVDNTTYTNDEPTENGTSGNENGDSTTDNDETLESMKIA